jgi:hypothetical protein
MLSHPFARKEANGWGTELVPIHAVKVLVVSAGNGIVQIVA